MNTSIKTTKIRPRNEAKSSYRSLRQVIFGLFWGQRKWLGWTAIIFLVFGLLDAYGASPTEDIAGKSRLFSQKQVEVVTNEIISLESQESEQAFDQTETGFLGGPMILGSLVSPIAQAYSVDLSTDDLLEDADVLLVQENSVISPSNPSGTVLFPEFRREIETYVVKQGDVPEKIAAQFGINADTLLWANGLKETDFIKPGQELMILPINGIRIKVGAKDNLASLAKKYNGDSMEIIAFNNLSLEGVIKEGDYLIIPDGELPPPPKPVVKPKPKTTAPKYAQSSIPAGWLIIPTTGTSWGRLHSSNGIDVANKCGTPIYAAAAGKVILSDGVGWNGGYGKYIKIQHPNGVITLYAHSSQLLVSEGEQVAQGQLIMLMGTTGRSTGCHLHWEVRGAANPLAGRKGSI